MAESICLLQLLYRLISTVNYITTNYNGAAVEGIYSVDL